MAHETFPQIISRLEGEIEKLKSENKDLWQAIEALAVPTPAPVENVQPEVQETPVPRSKKPRK